MKKNAGRKLRRQNRFKKSCTEIAHKANLNHRKQMKANKAKEKDNG